MLCVACVYLWNLQGVRIRAAETRRLAEQAHRLQQVLAALRSTLCDTSVAANLPALVRHVGDAVASAATAPLPQAQRTAARAGDARRTFAEAGTAWSVGRDLTLVQDEPLNRVRVCALCVFECMLVRRLHVCMCWGDGMRVVALAVQV